MATEYKSDYGFTAFSLDEIEELKQNYVLVKEDRIQEEQLPSGLFAPTTASGPGHYRLATVMMTGPGFRKTVTDERLLKYCRHDPVCRARWCGWCGVEIERHPIPEGITKCIAPEAQTCSCGLDRLLRGDYDPLDVQPGDRVMMGRHYDGDPLIIQGETFMLCREEDCVARIVPITGLWDDLVIDREFGLTLELLADRVLVELRQDLHIQHTMNAPSADTGLTLADVAQGSSFMGVARRVGPGWGLASGKREGMTVQEGDVVLFPGDTGQATRIGGKTFWTMRENEIIGVCDLERTMK